MDSKVARKTELERLREENAALREKAKVKITIKVSQKGAVSLYGLGRFPVTLYAEQWEHVLGMTDKIAEFIRANDGSLTRKAS